MSRDLADDKLALPHVNEVTLIRGLGWLEIIPLFRACEESDVFLCHTLIC